jgi:hypothetical protein
MNKKRMGAIFLALLICSLVSQASAQNAEPKFNSNGDDLTKIHGLLEEFRQDIIRKDGYALTKLVLNPDVLFHHTNTQEEIDSVTNITLSSTALARASSMDLRNSSLRRSTNSKRNFRTSRFARMVL